MKPSDPQGREERHRATLERADALRSLTNATVRAYLDERDRILTAAVVTAAHSPIECQAAALALRAHRDLCAWIIHSVDAGDRARDRQTEN